MPAARASKLTTGPGGRLKSARARIGGICSQAMSAWKTSGMTPAIASVLGKCRSQARMRNQASNARLGGNEARAQTLEKRADRGLTMKERLARAKELRAQRQGRASSSVQEQAAPVASKPSLRPASEVPVEGRKYAAENAQYAVNALQRSRWARWRATVTTGKELGGRSIEKLDRALLQRQRQELGITAEKLRASRNAQLNTIREAEKRGFDGRELVVQARRQAIEQARVDRNAHGRDLYMGVGYFPGPAQKLRDKAARNAQDITEFKKTSEAAERQRIALGIQANPTKVARNYRMRGQAGPAPGRGGKVQTAGQIQQQRAELEKANRAAKPIRTVNDLLVAGNERYRQRYKVREALYQDKILARRAEVLAAAKIRPEGPKGSKSSPAYWKWKERAGAALGADPEYVRLVNRYERGGKLMFNIRERRQNEYINATNIVSQHTLQDAIAQRQRYANSGQRASINYRVEPRIGARTQPAPAPAGPSLREQVAARRADKGSATQRAQALAARADKRVRSLKQSAKRSQAKQDTAGAVNKLQSAVTFAERRNKLMVRAGYYAGPTSKDKVIETTGRVISTAPALSAPAPAAGKPANRKFQLSAQPAKPNSGATATLLKKERWDYADQRAAEKLADNALMPEAKKRRLREMTGDYNRVLDNMRKYGESFPRPTRPTPKFFRAPGGAGALNRIAIRISKPAPQPAAVAAKPAAFQQPYVPPVFGMESLRPSSGRRSRHQTMEEKIRILSMAADPTTRAGYRAAGVESPSLAQRLALRERRDNRAVQYSNQQFMGAGRAKDRRIIDRAPVGQKQQVATALEQAKKVAARAKSKAKKLGDLAKPADAVAILKTIRDARRLARAAAR